MKSRTQILLLCLVITGCGSDPKPAQVDFSTQQQLTDAALNEKKDALPEYAFDLYRKTHVTHLALNEFVKAAGGHTHDIESEQEAKRSWYDENKTNRQLTEGVQKLIAETQSTLLAYAHQPALSPIQGELFDAWTRLETVSGLLRDKKPIGVVYDSGAEAAVAVDNGAEMYIRVTASTLKGIAVFSETLYDPQKEQADDFQLVPEVEEPSS